MAKSRFTATNIKASLIMICVFVGLAFFMGGDSVSMVFGILSVQFLLFVSCLTLMSMVGVVGLFFSMDALTYFFHDKYFEWMTKSFPQYKNGIVELKARPTYTEQVLKWLAKEYPDNIKLCEKTRTISLVVAPKVETK